MKKKILSKSFDYYMANEELSIHFTTLNELHSFIANRIGIKVTAVIKQLKVGLTINVVFEDMTKESQLSSIHAYHEEIGDNLEYDILKEKIDDIDQYEHIEQVKSWFSSLEHSFDVVELINNMLDDRTTDGLTALQSIFEDEDYPEVTKVAFLQKSVRRIQHSISFVQDRTILQRLPHLKPVFNTLLTAFEDTYGILKNIPLSKFLDDKVLIPKLSSAKTNKKLTVPTFFTLKRQLSFEKYKEINIALKRGNLIPKEVKSAQVEALFTDSKSTPIEWIGSIASLKLLVNTLRNQGIIESQGNTIWKTTATVFTHGRTDNLSNSIYNVKRIEESNAIPRRLLGDIISHFEEE